MWESLRQLNLDVSFRDSALTDTGRMARVMSAFALVTWRYEGVLASDVVNCFMQLPESGIRRYQVEVADDPTLLEFERRVSSCAGGDVLFAESSRGIDDAPFGQPERRDADGSCRLVLVIRRASEGHLRSYTLLYNPSAISADAASEALQAIDVVIRNYDDSQSHLMSDVEILSARKVAGVLQRSHGEQLPEEVYSEPRLHVQFERCVSECPGETAVVFQGRQVTYAELDDRADGLADLLLQRGVRRGMVVGIYLERRLELIIALIATMKASATCLPLDPDYPAQRVAQICSDARPTLTLHYGDIRPPESTAELFDLKDIATASNDSVFSEHNHDVVEQDIAFLLYTSGSTGRPKGVAMTHGGRGRRQLWTQHRYGATNGDRHLVKSPIGFGTLIREVFWPLTTGGIAVLCPAGDHRDVGRLVEIVRSQQISVVNFVPTLLREFLDHPDVTNCRSLRHVFCTGEALSVSTQERFFSLLDGCQLHVFYGSSEIPTATYCDIRPDTTSRFVTLGRPTDTSIYLLDNRQRLVPEGVRGEIYVGSADLAREYRGQADATADRFLTDPFSTQKGARMFRTGDVAIRRPDGQLEYCGRVDHQIQNRGVRVEPGEIERSLCQHSEVTEAVVVSRPQESMDSLVAFYVTSDGPLAQSELRHHISLHLPAQMIPNRFQWIPRIPLNAHGKTDRRSLQQHPITQQQPDDALPIGEMEQAVAAIWCEVLGLDSVGRDEDFFQIGGHSIAVLRVLERLRRRFRFSGSVKQFFANSSVRRITAAIRQSSENVAVVACRSASSGSQQNSPDSEQLHEHQATLEEIRDSSKGSTAKIMAQAVRVAPASGVQRRLWFLQLLNPKSSTYNVPTAWQFDCIDPSALQRSLSFLVARHETLRTLIMAHDGAPYQIVMPATSVDLIIEECGDEKDAMRRVVEHSREPVATLRTPQISALLLKISDGRSVLSLVVPHLSWDGHSRHVLHSELAGVYARFRQQRNPDALAELQPYSSYAIEEWRYRTGAKAVNVIESWKQRIPQDWARTEISGCMPISSAVQHPDYDAASRCERRLPESLRSAIHALGRRSGTTPFAVLATAVGIVAGRLSHRDDVMIGIPVSCRNQARWLGQIGCFVNVVPLLIDVSSADSFLKLLAHTSASVSHALDSALVSFETLIESVEPERSPGRNPIFEIALNYQDDVAEPLSLPGCPGRRIEVPESGAKYDLNIYAIDDGAALKFRLVYRSLLYSRDWAEQLLEQFETLLLQVCTAPERKPDQYSLVTPSFSRYVPDLRREIPVRRFQTVSEQFRIAAISTPDAVAISDGNVEMTYGSLMNEVDAIGSSLRCRGVKKGDRIAIIGSPSPELVATLLAVFQSGGITLLVDSSLPEKRQQAMLQGAGIQVAIGIGSHKLCDLSLDSLRDSLSAKDETESQVSVNSTDAACVFFTSGSSGTPKPLLFQHQGIAHFIEWERSYMEVDSSDRVAMLTRLSFDAILRDIFVPLTSGAALCLRPPENDELNHDVLRWLKSERITIVHTIPSIAQALLALQTRPVPLPEMRAVVFSGEPLTDTLTKRWKSSCPGSAIFINLYGPTETTMCKCFYRVPEDPTPGVQSIGQPMPDTDAVVISVHGRICGMGEIGEIVLRTPYRTLGYLNDPDQTGFVRNPYRDDSRDMLYQTGDLGRLRPDGKLEIIGRRDRQLKIRGARIAPQEVEQALVSLPEIAEASVYAQPDVRGELRLVAAVVQTPKAGLARAELIGQLRNELPSYMVPGKIVFIKSIPRTPAGKVDMTSLQSDSGEVSTDEPIYRPPRNPLELQLVRIWEATLSRSPIGIDEDFFLLGGHSLLAIQLMYRIEQLLGHSLPPTALFPVATIRRLADLLSREQPEHETLVPIQVGNSASTLFCVHPAGGSVLGFVDLARCLGSDQTVYGLQGPDPRSDEDPMEDVCEMARQYVNEICRFQERGPYYLLGYSFGGLVANEIASLLERDGKRVAMLVLLDPGFPEDRRAPSAAPSDHTIVHEVARLLERHPLEQASLSQSAEQLLWEDLRELAERHMKQNPGAAGIHQQRRSRGMGAVQEFFRANRLLPVDGSIGYDELHRYMLILRACFRAARNYVPASINGSVTLFRSETRLTRGGMESVDGQRLSWLGDSECEVHRVKGGHFELLSPPGIEFVAEVIKDRMSET